MSRMLLPLLFSSLVLPGCQDDPDHPVSAPAPAYRLVGEVMVTTHREGDDLLTAGLGLAGLRAQLPLPADSADPGPAELRRLAIRHNFASLVDVSPGGGFGSSYGSLGPYPGTELQVFAQLPDADHPFRVLVQVPDALDQDNPCLVVSPVSGSRGIYGATGIGGAIGLPAGCAVAYTDKGAGTDYFDLVAGKGFALDGRAAAPGEQPLGFAPAMSDEYSSPAGLAMPHAHSGDHPEADWGRHTLVAADFGLRVLARFHDAVDENNLDTARIIGVAISNGGAALLRALEADEYGLFDGAVVLAPNVTVAGQPPLFDYATLAALVQPCLLADGERTGRDPLAASGLERCTLLASAGMLEDDSPASAEAVLLAAGFDSAALETAGINVFLDLWRTVAAHYASAYLRTGPGEMPCGYAVAAVDADGQARAGTAEERVLWWSTGTGLTPAAGVELIDGLAAGSDPAMPGLTCLRSLMTGEHGDSQTLKAAVNDTLASARLPDIPVIIVHGRQDGLIPASISARPYVSLARDLGAKRLAYWEVDRAQHFDVLLAMPGIRGRYVPILPYGFEAFGQILSSLDRDRQPGPDRDIAARPPGVGERLEARHLGLDEHDDSD